MGINDRMVRAAQRLADKMGAKEIILGSNRLKLHNVPVQGYAISLTEAEVKMIFNDGMAHGFKQAREKNEATEPEFVK